MKKSSKVTGAQARTVAKVKQQAIDWKRVVIVGIDLGDRFSHYCTLDADGAVVSEGRVATTPGGAIELFFKTSRKRIAIEAGTHSPWMSRLRLACVMRSSWLTRASCR
ncbi:MAG: transposase [Acidobacteriota bacterium]|nr:transposase [Acidobacteriota bacterium]